MQELTIERINQNGDGIAAGAQPIARVLPDEVVDISAAPARILTPSPDRVAPPCRHFKTCGGCSMQHASDSFVANWKTEIIRTGLAARGIETDIRPILTSPAQSRRRATLHGRRTKKGAMIGLFARGTDTLIETPECQLVDPAILAKLPALEALTIAGASRKSTIALTVTISEAGLDVDVRDAKPIEPQDLTKMAALAEQHDLARLTWDGETIVTRRKPEQVFGAARVTPPPGAFLQATEHGQDVFSSCVADIVGEAKRVVDLFAGCGTFSLPAASTAEVWALEGEAELIRALDEGWRAASGLKKISSETRDLFRRPVLAAEFRKFDAVIIDPPRAGAEAQTKELAKSGIPVIAAVSCNPVSFARDAELLINGGYVLDWIQPVDQFRWSAHVELAARFHRS